MTIATTKNLEKIDFLSDGLTIMGLLQLPEGNGPFPIVILGHGLGALKEWILPEIANALAEIGIAGLWFDYRNMGDSEGLPRDEVAHYGRLQDWEAAISYASSLTEVDPGRLGVFGTSLGGRDVLTIAATNPQIKAVVAQTPLIKWSPSLAARMAGYGDDLVKFHHDIAEDRRNRTLAQDPHYLQFVKPTGEDVKAAFINHLSSEELRNFNNRITLQSYRPTALIDVLPFMELISPVPLLVILAEEDFLPGQKEAFGAAKEPKTLVTIPGNHFSPYWQSKDESIKATVEFFKDVFCS